MKATAKEIKKAKRLAFRHFDKILSASKETVKAYKLNGLPLITLKAIIKLAKLNESTESKLVNEHNASLNKTLDLLYSTCEKFVTEVKTDRLPIVQLKHYIEVIKDGYIKGLNQTI